MQILVIHIEHYVICYFRNKITIVKNGWEILLFV